MTVNSNSEQDRFSSIAIENFSGTERDDFGIVKVGGGDVESVARLEIKFDRVKLYQWESIQDINAGTDYEAEDWRLRCVVSYDGTDTEEFKQYFREAVDGVLRNDYAGFRGYDNYETTVERIVEAVGDKMEEMNKKADAGYDMRFGDADW